MTDQKQDGSRQKQQQFSIQRIYLKKVSFDSPQAPAIFSANKSPHIHVDVNSRYSALPDDLYESVLAIILRAKTDNKEPYCLVEFQQAGLFRIPNCKGAELERVLTTQCPTILFPYAREFMDSLMVKAGFPPIVLAPSNFYALYDTLRKKRGEASASDPWEQSTNRDPVTH